MCGCDYTTTIKGDVPNPNTPSTSRPPTTRRPTLVLRASRAGIGPGKAMENIKKHKDTKTILENLDKKKYP